MSSNTDVTTSVPGPAPGYTCALMSVSIVLLAPFLFGVTIGSSGPSIDTMKNEIIDSKGQFIRLDPHSEYVVFNSNQAALFGSLVTIGAMIGALVGGQLANWMGCKRTILTSVPFFVCSSFTLLYCSRVYALFAARLAVGFAVGINSFVAPLYINEVSPTHLRGMMGASNQLAVTIGILAVYFFGSLLRIDGLTVYSSAEAKWTGTSIDYSFCNWRALAFWNIVPATVLAIGVCFIPESPRWLASKGQLVAAKEALTKLLNGGTVIAETEALEELSRKFENKSTTTSTMKSLGAAWKQIGIAIALQFFQQFSGINAIMFYCTTIMRNAHLPHPEMVSIGVMFEQVIVTLVACALMDRWGRRALLLTGASVMAFSCTLFGLYFFLVSVFGATGIAALVYISVFLYIAAFSIGVGAIPWLIIGELMPDNVRAVGSSIATTANWAFAFAVTETLPHATEYLKYYGVMWTFAVCCLGLVVFTALCVPETLGKSLEEIQTYFNQNEAVTVEPKKERSARSVTDERTRLIDSDLPLNENQSLPSITKSAETLNLNQAAKNTLAQRRFEEFMRLTEKREDVSMI